MSGSLTITTAAWANCSDFQVVRYGRLFFAFFLNFPHFFAFGGLTDWRKSCNIIDTERETQTQCRKGAMKMTTAENLNKWVRKYEEKKEFSDINKRAIAHEWRETMDRYGDARLNVENSYMITDMARFCEILDEIGVNEFTLSDRSTALLGLICTLDKNGFGVAGTTELVRHDKWGTVYEPTPALIIRKK